MLKKILTLLALAQFYSSTAQVIEDFEIGPSIISSSEFRNQMGSFNIFDCNVPSVFGNNLTPVVGINLANQKATIVSSGTNEPILLSYNIFQDVVSSSGGKYALRLNNVNAAGADITSYSKKFFAKSKYLSFEYMAVLDSPHTENLNVQPFFTARILDENNQIIPNTQFCLIANPNDQLLVNPNNRLFYTKGWYCGTIIIPDEYLGQNLKAQFIAADCGLGGDIGVAYIDNIVNELKCESPTYGFINLDNQKFNCPKEKIKVCGTYSSPWNTNLGSIYLEIKQNGNIVNTLNSSSLIFMENGKFCFEVSPSDFPALTGDFEFNVIANFVAPNGFTHTLSYESTYDGPDVSCSCDEVVTPINYTIENLNYNIDKIIWPSFGNGSYHVQLSQDYACCGMNNTNDNIVVDYFVTSNYIISEEAGYYYYNTGGGSNPKCFRWRVKLDECTWSEWCCVSITGNYDGYDCKTSTNDFFTYSSKPKAKAYPNPTSDYVIIENSEAIIFDVYDLNNQKVKANLFEKSTKEIKINMHDLKPGIYIIKSNLNEEFKIIKK